MKSPEESAREVFGRRATNYTTSSCHTDPQVLGKVVELSGGRPDWRALDVATGTGHTAFALAPVVASVIGVDLTPEMLLEARQLSGRHSIANVVFQLADVHHLPCPDGSFDLVTCRRAPHHFSDIAKALGEMRRALRPGGRLVIDDRSVPEDDFIDSCMNQLDRLHDESHVRQYRPGEWRKMLEQAGFEVESVELYTRHRPIGSLTDGVSEANVRSVVQTLDGLDELQRRSLNLVKVEGVIHINHWYVMTSAVASYQ